MSHLDDLPTRTSDHVGETESREAFRRTFKDPLFLIREEQERDYGTDCLLEALLRNGTAPSNIRFHAQLKASTTDPNADGSYSYSVERTNLNYLLNSPRSIYVFYSRTAGTLLFRWAEDVYREYESRDPTWHKQASLTVRFSQVVDSVALQQIHSTVIESAQAEREFRLKLKIEGVCLTGAFTYDTATAELTDLDRIVELISSRGLAFAAHGYSAELLVLAERVPPERLTARMALALAYAAYLTARNGSALEYLRRCREEELPDAEQQAMAAHIRVSLQRSLGLLDTDGFGAAMRGVEERFPDTVSGIYARIERLRREGLTGENAELVDELDDLSQALDQRGPEWAPIAAQTKIVALEIRFHVLQGLFRGAVFLTRAAEADGLGNAMMSTRVAITKDLLSAYRAWLADYENTLAKADALHLDLIVAEGLYTLISCVLQDILLSDKLTPRAPDLEHGRRMRLERTLVRVEQARQRFLKAQAIEQELCVLLLGVDALWLLDRHDEAKDLASKIAAKASYNGFVEVYGRASVVMSGASPFPEHDTIPHIDD